LLGPTGCSKKETPEQRVRQLIERAEAAAEKKEIRELRSYVSERYADTEGNDKKKIEGVLRFYFLRNQSVHLYTYIESISLSAPTEAHAVVYVAMAGKAIAGPEELQRMQGDFFRFELDLAEEAKEWRVTRAAWRYAEPSDFVR
jgi:hypothetical protein